MSGWSAKVFWQTVATRPKDGGHEIVLDERPLRTPAKAALILPTLALADMVAAEWRAQTEKVLPETMPATRMANAALDKVIPQHGEVAGLLAAYGETDLLCYRAVEPVELVARQAQAWDGMLLWAETALSAKLAHTAGIVAIDQPPAAVAALLARVQALSAFEMAAFHDLVSLSGSLVLAFGVSLGEISADEAWQAAILDELWQEEKWGADEDATALRQIKAEAFAHAAIFFAAAETGAVG